MMSSCSWAFIFTQYSSGRKKPNIFIVFEGRNIGWDWWICSCPQQVSDRLIAASLVCMHYSMSVPLILRFLWHYCTLYFIRIRINLLPSRTSSGSSGRVSLSDRHWKTPQPSPLSSYTPILRSPIPPHTRPPLERPILYASPAKSTVNSPADLLVLDTAHHLLIKQANTWFFVYVYFFLNDLWTFWW